MKKYLAIIIPAVLVGPLILLWAIGSAMEFLSSEYQAHALARRQAEQSTRELVKWRDTEECADHGLKSRVGLKAQLVVRGRAI